MAVCFLHTDQPASSAITALAKAISAARTDEGVPAEYHHAGIEDGRMRSAVDRAAHDRPVRQLNIRLPVPHLDGAIHQAAIAAGLCVLDERSANVAGRLGVALLEARAEADTIGDAAIGARVLRALEPVESAGNMLGRVQIVGIRFVEP